jgi:hypothetical protein
MDFDSDPAENPKHNLTHQESTSPYDEFLSKPFLRDGQDLLLNFDALESFEPLAPFDPLEPLDRLVDFWRNVLDSDPSTSGNCDPPESLMRLEPSNALSQYHEQENDGFNHTPDSDFLYQTMLPSQNDTEIKVANVSTLQPEQPLPDYGSQFIEPDLLANNIVPKSTASLPDLPIIPISINNQQSILSDAPKAFFETSRDSFLNENTAIDSILPQFGEDGSLTITPVQSEIAEWNPGDSLDLMAMNAGYGPLEPFPSTAMQFPLQSWDPSIEQPDIFDSLNADFSTSNPIPLQASPSDGQTLALDVPAILEMSGFTSQSANFPVESEPIVSQGVSSTAAATPISQELHVTPLDDPEIEHRDVRQRLEIPSTMALQTVTQSSHAKTTSSGRLKNIPEWQQTHLSVFSVSAGSTEGERPVKRYPIFCNPN